MRARPLASRLFLGALAAAALTALAACGGGQSDTSAAPAAEIEFAEEAPLPEIPAAAPAPAPVETASTPAEPIPYDQTQRGPAQKADAENENVFY